MKKQKRNSGITLVALVISIIVMLILAGVSLSAIVGENGIISNATEAGVMSRFSSYDEDLKLNTVSKSNIYAIGEGLKEYIPRMEDKDLNNFVIVKDELIYIGTDELETSIAEELGMGVMGNSDKIDIDALKNEVSSIIDGVLDLKDVYGDKLTDNDAELIEEKENTDTSLGIIGTRLFDRNSFNIYRKTWNILVEYDNDYKEIKRYGSGYYWLKLGETYAINGKEITLKNNYVINYMTGDFLIIPFDVVNWNNDSTLGVKDNLVLNLDSVSLSNGSWVDIGDGCKEFEVVNQKDRYF